MAVRLPCPNCGKELRAPEELLGKKVVCPRCSDSFRVSLPSDSGPRISLSNAGSLLAGEGSAAAPPDATASKEPTAPSPAALPARTAPPKPAPPVNTPPVNTPPVNTPSADQTRSTERTEAKQQPAKAVPRVKPVASKRVRATQPQIKRKVKPARFIAGNATKTRVQLGADGKLPNLVLRDDAIKKEQEEKSTEASNPLFLVGVLCFSVTMSVLLLFVDTTAKPSETRSKAEARATIRECYIGIGESEPFEPYQEKLREAQQSHNRKDAEAEKVLYREVVDLLRDESNPEFKGLTGTVVGDKAPNDRHLEGLLSTLLNEE